MSRTKQSSNLPNPATKFIALSGTTGKFGYWDKTQEKKVELDYPITFLPLDVLFAIKGFSNNHSSGIYSNEIHSLSNEKFSVRIFGQGEFANGFYKEIKEKIATEGGKFANIVYGVMKDDDDMNIVCFQFYGASLSPFIDYQKIAKNIYANAIQIVGSKEAKKGNISYYVPEFKSIKVSEESSKKADELDKELQKYFVAKTHKEKEEPDEVNEEPEENDDLPF